MKIIGQQILSTWYYDFQVGIQQITDTELGNIMMLKEKHIFLVEECQAKRMFKRK